MAQRVKRASAMVTAPRPAPGCFSLLQFQTIINWRAAQHRGFGVRVMTDHEDYPELAELYKHDRMSPLWFLSATEAGTALIVKASGSTEEVGSVEEALKRVLLRDHLESTAV